MTLFLAVAAIFLVAMILIAFGFSGRKGGGCGCRHGKEIGGEECGEESCRRR